MSIAMQYMSCVIVLSACIHQGDGRWKERDKENVKDIVAYKKMAEKLEREIEKFYDDYPNEWLKGDIIDQLQYKHLRKILNDNTKTTKGDTNKDKSEPTFPLITDGTTSTKPSSTTENNAPNNQKSVNVKLFNNSEPHSDWPKFENLLLQMGRIYDWKNDRWKKVKRKFNDSEKQMKDDENSIHNWNERHKFSYRIVKLNKSKSRRNVVVAVSAVR